MRRSVRVSHIIRLLVAGVLVAAMVPLGAGVATATPAVPTTRYVDVVHGSDLTGTGAVTAPFKTITKATELAGWSDTIVVAPGAYTAASGEDFPIMLYGEMQLISSAGSDLTIIDPDFSAAAIVVGSMEAAVPSISMSDAPVRVSGFTINNGADYDGGGIQCYYSELTCDDLVVEGCIARFGGGLMAQESSVTVDGCAFIDNGWTEDLIESATETNTVTMVGGAIGAEWGNLTVLDSEFTGNAAEYLGGAIAADENVVIDGCTFEENLVTSDSMPGAVSDQVDDTSLVNLAQTTLMESFGGAVGVVSDVPSAVEISDCTFTDNGAYRGGAVGVGYTFDLETQITDCTFAGNFAYVGAGVAAVMLDPVPQGATADASRSLETDSIPLNVLVDRCEFSGNESFAGSGVFSEIGVTVANSLFTGGWDVYAPVSGVESGETLVIGSTFADNMGSASVYVEGSGLMTNCISWGREVVTGDGLDSRVPDASKGDATELAARPSGFVEDNYGIYATFCDLEYPGDGADNISEDPMFLDPVGGNYRLDVGSPCIDAGQDEWDFATDLDGFARPVDGDGNGDAEFDMGAYEFASESVERLAGLDRYATAVEVSKQHFPTEGVETVVLATGRVFADGLAASGLAGAYDAPLLLTAADYLPDVVIGELERLGASEVIMCGGTSAIAAAVARDLEDLGYDVERIGGADRYETAALIADRIELVMGEDFAGIAFIARGDLFPDALAASPIAYGLAAPILLVEPDALPPATVDVISGLEMNKVVVIGGTSAVGTTVAQGLGALAPGVERVQGDDRYETAALLSEYAVDQEWSSWLITGLATGETFPDALSGGAAIGSDGGVLLLTPRTSLHPAAADMLETYSDEIAQVRVLGGSAAVDSDVMNAVEAIIAPTP